MQCLSCLLAHIILKLSYREVSHLIFSVKVYHKPTTPPTKVTRQKKPFGVLPLFPASSSFFSFFYFIVEWQVAHPTQQGRQSLESSSDRLRDVPIMLQQCVMIVALGCTSWIVEVLGQGWAELSAAVTSSFVNKVSEDKGRLADAIPANSLQNRTEILGSCHVLVW